MRTSKILFSLLATTILAGCTISGEANRNIKSVNDTATGLLPTAARPMEAANKSPVNVNEGVFVGTKSFRNENGDPLPSRFETDSGITIVRQNPASLRDVAAAVTEYTSIPVVVSASVPSGQQQQEQAVPDFAAGPMPEGFPLEQALAEISNSGPGGGQITASNSAATASAIPLNYSGKLSGLLDIVSAHFNVAWSYEKGRIVLNQTITRSFDVPVLPILVGLNFDLGSQTGEETTAGTQASTSSETNAYDDLVNGLQSLVGEGSFAINKVTGVVTVTGSPATVARVQTYLDGLNERLSEQVALSVKVYSVTLNDEENFGLDINALFQDAGNFGVDLVGSGTATAAAGGGSLGWALLDETSEFSGSSAAIQALAKRGDVSVVTTASVTTVNGQPVPLQVGQTRDYVSEISVEEGEDTETTTFETDTVSTGFGLHLVPRIQRNGDVLLQYGINISELVGEEDGFDVREIGGNTVQLRRMDQRNFIQQARIPNNNTLVLAGFEQVRSSSIKSGTGRANFPLFGGGSSASMEREVVVIMITPTVLKN